MRFFSKNISSLAKSLWRLKVEVLLFLLIIPAFADLVKPGYFPMHDDLQIFRLYEIHKCVLDGQIPCRWVPDAGFGYGYPLMQFYPPMPYYPMEIMVLLGFGFFWPVKIMFALSFIVSGLGMYLLAKEFFGKWGGVLSALLYVYAPYHSVDIYVRGAMNEGWGMAWFPFVLLFIYRLIKDPNKKNIAFLSLALLGQLTSHNVMTLVFTPSAILWALFWLWRTKKYQSVKQLIISGLLGVGLSAFFFLPVILEQRFVHVESMTVGYFNYLAHFADLKQLFFSRFWGYGGSTWGPEDGMSFSIGQIQWILAILAAIISVVQLSFLRRQESKNNNLLIMIPLLVLFGFFYAFLTHNRSVFIWDRLSMLQFAQFPWRLVALIVFYFSFAGGYLASFKIPKTIGFIVFPLLIISILIWNLPFFLVEKHTRITIQEKLSGREWELQVTGGIFDYLPQSAPKPPGGPAFSTPQYLEGAGGVLDLKSGTNWFKFTANVSSPSAKIMLPLYTFPGLVTEVDGKKQAAEVDKDLGRVIVTVPFGQRAVSAKIGYTPVRLFSDLITLFSIYLLYTFLYDRKR